MATRYGYDKAIGLTGPLSVDWSQVTGETVKYLNQLQEKKDTTRKELATESRELAQQLAKNPYDYTSKYYGFWGKSSNQVMNLMTTLNDNFQNGNISKTDRDIKSANLQGQVEQYIAASQKFAQQEKERAKNSGPNGMYGAEDIFENEILSTALNYENIEPLFDPDSHSFNVLATGSDGVTRIMSGNEVFSSVERPVIGRYNMNENIKKAFERINVKTITKADGSIVAGDFVTTQGEEADNALRNLAQTMIQQPVQLRSMLSSYPISIKEDGKVKNYEFDREFLPSEAYDIGGKVNMDVVNKLHQENPTIFYRDIQGNYYESDRARDIGEKYAMEQLTLAAEYTKKEAKVTSNFDDNIKTILDLTLIAQRSGQVINKETLGVLLAGAKGGLDFETLSSALGSGIFTDAPVKISPTELKEQMDREKALRDAIKIDDAKAYLKENLFTVDGGIVNPAEGDNYTDAEIENLLTPLGLNIQKDDAENVIVYNGNTAVLNLGKDVTKERMELLKTALIAGSEDEIYALFRRSNPEYTYEGDVLPTYILDPTD